MVLLFGLRMVKAKEMRSCIIEGNFFLVVSWCKRLSPGYWILSHQLREMRDLCSRMAVEVVHVPKCQNSLADSLAKWGVGAQEMFMGESFLDGMSIS